MVLFFVLCYLFDFNCYENVFIYCTLIPQEGLEFLINFQTFQKKKKLSNAHYNTHIFHSHNNWIASQCKRAWTNSRVQQWFYRCVRHVLAGSDVRLPQRIDFGSIFILLPSLFILKAHALWGTFHHRPSCRSKILASNAFTGGRWQEKISQ